MLFAPIFTLLIFELLARLKYTPGSQRNDGLFEYHPSKVFTLKRNYSGIYSEKEITTNQHGYRDELFPYQKPENEIRILALGDSVTFGAWVLASETYTEQLEDSLNQKPLNRSCQVINAGSPGNGPMQEYYDLKEGLELDPDLIILQFTLNDVTEPFVFLKRLGGSGWSYHGIEDIPVMDYYLSQHSALYSLAKNWYAEKTYKGDDSDTLQERGKKQEIYQKEKLITHHQHESIRLAWEEYFSWLSKIASFSKQQGIPIILLISPFEFQLTSSSSTDYPQQKLTLFCKEHNIPCIDLLQVLRHKFSSFSSNQSNPSSPSLFWIYILMIMITIHPKVMNW